MRQRRQQGTLHASSTAGDAEAAEVSDETASKMKLDHDFWASWDVRHAANQKHQSGSASPSCPVETELNKFVYEPILARESDPILWWCDNAARFPSLSNAAQWYLAAPANSVPSERLFSLAGDICSEKRTCLLAENIEHLVFLKANLINF